MTGEKTKIHGWQEQFDLSGDELGFIIKCLQARVDFLARLLLNEVSEYFQSEIDYLTPIIAKMSV